MVLHHFSGIVVRCASLPPGLSEKGEKYRGGEIQGQKPRSVAHRTKLSGNQLTTFQENCNAACQAAHVGGFRLPIQH
jgi:hypothetical protein